MKPATFTLPLQPLAPQRAITVRAQANDAPPPRWAGFEPVALPVLRQVLRPHYIETRKSFDTAGFRVEVAETIGRRPTQEDAFFVTCTPARSAHDTADFLKAAFEHTHQHTLDNSAGATCTLAVVSAHNTLTFAHLGDSPATLFVLDTDTRTIHYKPLLTHHNHEHPGERRRLDDLQANTPGLRLEFNGPYVRDGNGGLAVTRAFGDSIHDAWIGREPDITQVSLHQLLPGLRAHDRVFLCVSCDGLTENSRDETNPYEGLSEALARAVFDQDESRIAARLVQQAWMRSRDNITAMVVELPPGGRAGPRDLVLGVADGHRGASTAREAARVLASFCHDAPPVREAKTRAARLWRDRLAPRFLRDK